MFVVYNTETKRYRGKGNWRGSPSRWVTRLSRAKVYSSESTALYSNSPQYKTKAFKTFLEEGGKYFDYSGKKFDAILPDKLQILKLNASLSEGEK